MTDTTTDVDAFIAMLLNDAEPDSDLVRLEDDNCDLRAQLSQKDDLVRRLVGIIDSLSEALVK